MTSLGNYGIMTLSRGPYELDKMSLFQDLKLKRRKVDSRCSSDGESLADTSTSSPDLLTPLSPKMSDQPSQNNNSMHQSSSASSLASATPPPSTPTPPDNQQPTISVRRNLSESQSEENNPSTTTNEVDTQKPNYGNANGNNGNQSVIRSVADERPRSRSHSPAPSSPQMRVNRSPINILHHQLQQSYSSASNASTTSSPAALSSTYDHNTALTSITQQILQQHQSQQHVTVLVTPPRIKNETLHNALIMGSRKMQMQQQQQQQQQQQLQNNNCGPPSSMGHNNGNGNVNDIINTSMASHMQHHPHHVQIQMFSQPVSTTQIVKRSTGQTSPNNYNPPNSQAQSVNIPLPIQQTFQHALQQQIRIKRERSPSNLTQLGGAGQALSIIPSPNQHRQPQLSPHQMQQVNQHGNQIQIRQQLGGMRDAAILFRVKNEPQFPPGLMQNQHRMMWGPQTRINGVKPEVIGGPLPPLRTQMSPQSSPQQTSPIQTPPSARSTPTVIMGESCGVRTMVWGFEPVTPPQQQTPTPPHQTPPSTSQHSNSSSNHSTHSTASNNEEAAHLLLSLGQTNRGPMPIDNRARPQTRPPHALNMERLWAGDYSQLPAGQQMHALNLSAQQQQQQWLSGAQGAISNKFLQDQLEDGNHDEDDQPLVCMICEDKATGLHYGIITCEGCKGFFKRTVQNRRVYTCVADGTCEITKAQRNRCQYCRFKKCIEQGMVLQAVREDRMPGGRNSGAVYNLYKVKYKKHKKNNSPKGSNGNQKAGNGNMNDPKSMMLASSPHNLTNTPSPPQPKPENNIVLPASLLNGNILKAALTNPSEIVHLRHRLDNAVSSSRDRSISYEHSLNMIQTLIECDGMEEIATLPHFSEFLEDKSEIGDKLCNIGDSIVHKLVSWTKKLPFYLEIPVEIHTKLLTDKWHEILVLTTAAYQAMHGRKYNQALQNPSGPNHALDKHDPELNQEITAHLHTLQTCLTTLMGHPISMEQLKLDVGLMVEKMTQITIMFRRIKLKMEEYVCLKVYILLNKEVELESIQERYVQVLRSYLQHTSPHNPGRLNDLLAHIPEIQTAANLLLESKMFYVPFVLNSASIR